MKKLELTKPIRILYILLCIAIVIFLIYKIEKIQNNKQKPEYVIENVTRFYSEECKDRCNEGLNYWYDEDTKSIKWLYAEKLDSGCSHLVLNIDPVKIEDGIIKVYLKNYYNSDQCHSAGYNIIQGNIRLPKGTKVVAEIEK